MKIQIKNRYDNTVIFETDAEAIGGAVAAAVIAKANLYGANLRDADLRCADLRDADLRDADLRDADLRCANLRCANLYGANLRDADLRCANLRDADLRCANLEGADLRCANLEGAKIKDLAAIVSTRTILPDGDLIGWKKLTDGVICKLRIPSDAKRVGGVIGRKCRAEFADVLEGEGYSQHDREFAYKPGTRVTPDTFDPNPLVECSGGIHFFITRKEAEDY